MNRLDEYGYASLYKALKHKYKYALSTNLPCVSRHSQFLALLCIFPELISLQESCGSRFRLISRLFGCLKGRLQSLLRMCDRFVMRSLLITSFQSHGVNENTRGRLNRSLLYCKERSRIKSWHKNCCFELEFQDQTINIGFWKRGKSRRVKV